MSKQSEDSDQRQAAQHEIAACNCRCLSLDHFALGFTQAVDGVVAVGQFLDGLVEAHGIERDAAGLRKADHQIRDGRSCDWWQRMSGNDAVQRLFGAGHGNVDVQALAGIETSQHRLDLFAAAVRGFAEPLARMKYAMPATEPDMRRLKAIEDGDEYDRPLAIQMEALLYMASEPPGVDEPGGAVLLDRIVDVARQHWPKLVSSLRGLERRRTQRSRQCPTTLPHG